MVEGHRRWVALILVSVVAVGVLGLLATQLELSGAKERPCGTALRIDLRTPAVLRQHASELAVSNDEGIPPEEARRQADQALVAAASLEDRCKDRQRVALVGLAAGGAAAASAVAWSTYCLGRRAGRMEARRDRAPDDAP